MIPKPQSYERFLAVDGQTEFKLVQRYLPNTQSVFVSINGLTAEPGVGFTEGDNNTITLTSPCYEGDVIIVSHLKEIAPGIRMGTGDIVGTKATSLFKRYSSDERLLSNQRYTLFLHIAGKDTEVSFTSAYAPLYATRKMVENDLVKIIDHIDTNSIDYHLWENSKAVLELGDYTFLDDGGKPLTATRQWVRYRTVLDLINIVYIGIAVNQGETEKELGDLRIRRNSKIPYLDELLKEYESKLTTEYNKITGVRTSIASAVRAGNTAYPITTSRRSF